MSALLKDLDSRGLLEETLVVWMGDMGRTPRINDGAGRDHWSFCYSLVMAGGGHSRRAGLRFLRSQRGVSLHQSGRPRRCRGDHLSLPGHRSSYRRGRSAGTSTCHQHREAAPSVAGVSERGRPSADEGEATHGSQSISWHRRYRRRHLMAAEPADPSGGETLYNGIRLPFPWPPRIAEVPRDPVTPPYLKTPPAVIPIDIGRQLLVDDFLIEETTLQRTFHTPRPHSDNPLVRPDKPWERQGTGPMAMVFSDGVWYDPKDRLFKMWYMGGYAQCTCYAQSEDGIRWTKPELDVRKGTNIVQPDFRDSTTVWLDLEEKKSPKMGRPTLRHEQRALPHRDAPSAPGRKIKSAASRYSAQNDEPHPLGLRFRRPPPPAELPLARRPFRRRHPALRGAMSPEMDRAEDVAKKIKTELEMRGLHNEPARHRHRRAAHSLRITKAKASP